MTQKINTAAIPTNWEELIAAFENYLVQKERAENSVAAYSLTLRKFGEFYVKELKKTGPYLARLKPNDLQAFIQHLESSRYLSGSTVNQSVSALRSFSRFLIRQRWIRTDIAVGLKTHFIIHGRRHERLAEKEKRKLIDAPHLFRREEERDRAILQMMLQCGLRVNEVATLSIEDIKSAKKDKFVQIRAGQGAQARKIKLNTAASRALDEYFYTRGGLRQDDPVFISNRGKRLSPKTIQYLAKKYLCVIDRSELSADDLRYEFACRLYEKTGDINLVKEALGHRNKVTTSRYLEEVK